MKTKTKFILAIGIIFLFSINLINAQPNYKIAPYNSTADFYSLKQDFYTWLNQQNLTDPYIVRAHKKFDRFEFYWKNKVANSSTYTGSFTEYSNEFGQYWASPKCIGSDESDWKMIGPYPSGKQNMGYVKAIYCDPDDQTFILAGVGRNGGIFRSTDGGVNWEDVTTPQKIPALGITSFAVSPNKNGNNRVIYASTGGDHFSLGILKSEDNGQNWIALPNFPLHFNGDFGYCVEKVIVSQNISPTQDDIICAVAKNTFYKSTDGGQSWLPPYQFGPTVGKICDLEVNPNDNNKIIISTHSTTINSVFHRAKVFYSSDGGSSWGGPLEEDILQNLSYTNLANVEIAVVDYPSSGRIYAYTAFGKERKVSYTENYGTSWTTLAGNWYQDCSLPSAPPNCHDVAGQFNISSFEVTSNYQNIYIGSENFLINNVLQSNYYYAPNSVTHAGIRFIEILGTNQYG